MPPLALSLQDPQFIEACYIAAAVCFIYGLRRLSHPSTARSGNVVAAVGMAIAVAATLLDRAIIDFPLIVLGIVVGTAIGIPAARSVRMTAMPQMVALFNGVGGGAAALIAWTEFRDSGAAEIPLDTEIAILFSTVVGAVSFWGSIVAFAKLQELVSGRPIVMPGQQVVNGLILAGRPRRMRLPRGRRRRAVDVHRDPGRWPRSSAWRWCCRSAAPTCRS